MGDQAEEKPDCAVTRQLTPLAETKIQGKPDVDRFVGILGLSLGVLLFLLQGNGVEMNWIMSFILYAVVAASCAWSITRHAVPHLKTNAKTLITVFVLCAIGTVGYIGTMKQYRRDHNGKIVERKEGGSLPLTRRNEAVVAGPPNMPLQSTAKSKVLASTFKEHHAQFYGLGHPAGVPPTPRTQEPTTPEPSSIEAALPDVTLRFVYPKSPALLLINSSAALARDIKWSVILWNIDLPDRNDPLPIPTQTFDWLRPGDNGGPQNLFSEPTVSPLLKPGNRLLGSASVLCPTCDRGHTYIVYIVWGERGWFYEVKDERSGHLILPRKFSKEAMEGYRRELEAMIPEGEKVQIGEWP